jgi:hypothetical protein
MKSVHNTELRKITCLIFSIGVFLNIASSYPVEAGESREEYHFAKRMFSTLRAGSINGKAGVYFEHISYEKDLFVEEDQNIKLDDSNLVIPYFQVDYISPRYRDITFGAGLTGYTSINDRSEKKNGISDPDSIIFHHLYLSYALSDTTLKLGRQSFKDSIFLTDYYEAFSIHTNEIDTVMFSFYLVDKVAESDIDTFTEFENINRSNEKIDDFLYAAEAGWNIIEGSLKTTLYYYHQGHLYDLYGARFMFSHDILDDLSLGFHFDFYATVEDSSNGMRNVNDDVDDTNIFHCTPYLEFHGLTLSAGYIEADRLVGAREGGLIDDYFNPLNEGNQVYEPDAKTWYGALEYQRDQYTIGLIIGSTDYRDDGQRLEETEFDLNAGYTFREGFMLEAELAHVQSDSPEGDFTLLEMAFTFNF